MGGDAEGSLDKVLHIKKAVIWIVKREVQEATMYLGGWMGDKLTHYFGGKTL